MNVDYFLVKDVLPVVVIDNYYNQESLNKIWSEFDDLCDGNHLLLPENLGSALKEINSGTGEKIWKRQAKGLFLDNFYTDREQSNILKINRQIFHHSIVNRLLNFHPYFRHIKISTFDSTLIQYYDDSDYYEPHMDEASVTVCSWFYKEPKKFDGGNFVLENYHNVECKNNRTIIFPSILLHGVDNIKMPEKFRNQKFGRFSITQLIGYY